MSQPDTDTIRLLRPIEALQRDFISVMTQAAVVGHFWADLSEAKRFASQYASSQTETKLTVTHLIVKAAAKAALASPSLHRMFGPFHALDPAHADVGVSVEGQELLTPWYVVREADQKTLPQIAQELKAGAARVKDEDARLNAAIQRYLFLFPFPVLRRIFTRALMQSLRFRRQLVGTIQFSNVGPFGIDWAEVPLVAELLLVGGALEKRPVVDANDQVVVKLGAQFTLSGSHRKVNGRTTGEFIRAFRNLLQEPEKL